MMLLYALTLTLALITTVCPRFVLRPGAFLKLPARNNRYSIDNGAATKASYDPQENFLYVIGHEADVLHVINMTDPGHPVLLDTKEFDMVNMGLPDSLQVCRGGANREFLGMAFEAKDQLELSHVHLFELLDSSNYDQALTNLKMHATLDAFDPKGLAWKKDCSQLLVASLGEPHQTPNGDFVDPPASLEILMPSFGSNINIRKLPIDENQLDRAGVRNVFQRCDDNGGHPAPPVSTRTQDLQPKAVTVDDNNMAYILFQDNNAIGTLDLTDPFAQVAYYDLGTKDWSGAFHFDGSSDDGGVNLKPRPLRSLYQPGDVVSFTLGGKTYLATADTGSYRSYRYHQCTFDESSVATEWNEAFSDGMSPAEIAELQSAMSQNTEIGQLRVSKVRSVNDGWDSNYEGYDFVCTYGGRGFSILDAATMTRVYDSGDAFERYFLANATGMERSVYNGLLGHADGVQSATFDRGSPVMGPRPQALTVAEVDSNTKVLVIANGEVGGLYAYSVRPGPQVQFEDFVRRGEPGLTWQAAYNWDNDAVGEPNITDLVYFEDQGQRTVVAVSSFAGAISVYRLDEMN